MLITILISFLILTFASIVRTTAGFGYSMIAVPILALIVSPTAAVVATGILTLPQSLWSAVHGRKYLDKRIISVATVTGLLGVPCGIYILETFNEQSLLLMITFMVLLGTVLIWQKITIPGGLYALGAASAITGIEFGATGIHGPLMVAASSGLKLDNKVMRATLGIIYTATAIVSIIEYFVYHRIHTMSSYLVIIGLPALILGIFIGEKIFTKLNQDGFRRLVIVLLVISSCSTLIKILVSV